MVAKTPALRAQVISQTIPLVLTAMPAIKRKSVDRMCQEKHCTAEQDQTLRKVVENALGSTVKR